MLRRDFLKRFGIGAAAVVAAPSIIKAVEPTSDPALETTRYDLPNGKTVHLADINHVRQYPYTPDECYISQWDELHMHEFNQEIHEELIKRYGERMGIWDFLNITS